MGRVRGNSSESSHGSQGDGCGSSCCPQAVDSVSSWPLV
ncbi:hypothetical protein SNL152K_5016 [Streptomyces sp. NL15-2K]|nr:hypothetical protein SNL152K_5016 [Streptomyces sp. NL15-2K]